MGLDVVWSGLVWCGVVWCGGVGWGLCWIVLVAIELASARAGRRKGRREQLHGGAFDCNAQCA